MNTPDSDFVFTCRCCIRCELGNTIISLNLHSLYDKTEGVSIAEIYTATMPQIVISPLDCLPQVICESCLNKLLEVQKFQKMCLASEQKLRGILENINKKQQTADTVPTLANEIMVKEELVIDEDIKWPVMVTESTSEDIKPVVVYEKDDTEEFDECAYLKNFDEGLPQEPSTFESLRLQRKRDAAAARNRKYRARKKATQQARSDFIQTDQSSQDPSTLEYLRLQRKRDATAARTRNYRARKKAKLSAFESTQQQRTRIESNPRRNVELMAEADFMQTVQSSQDIKLQQEPSTLESLRLERKREAAAAFESLRLQRKRDASAARVRKHRAKKREYISPLH